MIVLELAPKPESTVDAEPVTVDILTFAHWIETSKQILDDVGELRAILDGILRGGLLDVIDANIYTTLTTSGNFTVFTPTASETIGDGVARIAAQIANQGGSNIIVGLNPLDYLTMQLTKADTRRIWPRAWCPSRPSRKARSSRLRRRVAQAGPIGRASTSSQDSRTMTLSRTP